VEKSPEVFNNIQGCGEQTITADGSALSFDTDMSS
jgi:hypothetical protein